MDQMQKEKITIPFNSTRETNDGFRVSYGRHEGMGSYQGPVITASYPGYGSKGSALLVGESLWGKIQENSTENRENRKIG